MPADGQRMADGLKWCSFCEVGHSASCCHPGRRWTVLLEAERDRLLALVAERDAEIARFKDALLRVPGVVGREVVEAGGGSSLAQMAADAAKTVTRDVFAKATP